MSIFCGVLENVSVLMNVLHLFCYARLKNDKPAIFSPSFFYLITMDNSLQPPHHHTHVFDPALHHTTDDPQQQQQQQQQPQQQQNESVSTAGLNPDGTPVKRRPGRPKGSTKKNLLAGSPVPPKIKRPVGRPRKDGLPAGSIGPRVKRERTMVPAVRNTCCRILLCEADDGPG